MQLESHVRARADELTRPHAPARARARTRVRTQTLYENAALQRYGPRFPRLKQGLAELTAITAPVLVALAILVVLLVLLVVLLALVLAGRISC
jgi:Holliday junction resolvase RusA-like endonuclease